MKSIIIISIILISNTYIFSQIPTYQWAYSIGDVGQENLDDIATDSENNIIISGQMYSTTDMDPTEFSEILYQIGQQDAFIEKFNADGYVEWGLNFGGAYYDGVYQIAVDKDDNIFAVGYYRGTIDCDPDMVDVANIPGYGGYDMFLVKFDKNGEFIWAHGFGDVSALDYDDFVNSVAVDDDGSVYITGQFRGSIDFDPGPDVHAINATITSIDCFAAKYNADGEYQWAFRISGFDGEYGTAITIDNNSDVIIAGQFEGTAEFSGHLITAAGGEILGYPKEGDVFIAKHNSDDGSYIWAKTIFGDTEQNAGYSNNAFALKTDADNNIYITGLLYGEGDFDMNDDEFIVTAYGDYDNYFAKYSPEGDLIWVHTTAPKLPGYNLDMAIDGNNDIYLTGFFGYSTGVPYEADFDFNPDSIYALQSLGENDIYIAKYDSSAELLWAFSLGGSEYDYATAIALDNDYNICVGGWFFNTDDFDANPDSNFIWLPYTAPDWGDNIWMGKYKQDGITIPQDTTDNPSGIDEITQNNSFIIYPNPAENNIQLKNVNSELFNAQIEILNIHGEVINSFVYKNSSIDISALPVGLYFIRIENEIQKFVKSDF